jgi:hypothetical protein
VEKLSEGCRGDLMHSLVHCLLMANKFYETKKPEYYCKDRDNMREIHENAEGVKKESGSKNKRVRGKT